MAVLGCPHYVRGWVCGQLAGFGLENDSKRLRFSKPPLILERFKLKLYSLWTKWTEVGSRVARFSESKATTKLSRSLSLYQTHDTDSGLLFNNLCFETNILKVYQYLKLGCIDSFYSTPWECRICPISGFMYPPGWEPLSFGLLRHDISVNNWPGIIRDNWYPWSSWDFLKFILKSFIYTYIHIWNIDTYSTVAKPTPWGFFIWFSHSHVHINFIFIALSKSNFSRKNDCQAPSSDPALQSLSLNGFCGDQWTTLVGWGFPKMVLPNNHRFSY